MIDYAKDIILNSNLSIRRNIQDFDYPTTMSFEDSQKTIDILREIYKDEIILLSDLDEEVLDKLVADLILSEDWHEKNLQMAAIIKDEYVIIVNDRDHIAINIRNFGMDFKKSYKKAKEIESYLDDKIDFSFSPEYGYLTSDARNAGSGVEIRLKMFLFGLVDKDETYVGFKQALASHGMIGTRFLPLDYDEFVDYLYLIKNFGNYRDDMDSFIRSMSENVDTLVRNERRFRRDFKILNNIDDEEVKEEIALSLNNLRSGKLSNNKIIANELYKLKKYNNLDYDTDLSNDEIDYLIDKLVNKKYEGKNDPKRAYFLNSYMKER
ncbi:ATP--guanido phosphotransferase [Anaerococcus sp. Marseille-P3625]|uniref:ATP--guanido phosphotransferase n=1 Tax=Anaerococcus sp. Marseille-P3625 TaxID=1977277 RepID=UPI002151576D|nr:ATP--guanido phosphotransferase [Anaerococcus sp. Marseille-P3625]